MIVKHPTFDDVQYDVPEKDAKRWQKAGWLVDEHKKPAASSPHKQSRDDSGA